MLATISGPFLWLAIVAVDNHSNTRHSPARM